MFYVLEEDKIFEEYDKYFDKTCIIYVNNLESLKKYYNLSFGYYITISKLDGDWRELIVRDGFNNMNRDKSKKEMFVCN